MPRKFGKMTPKKDQQCSARIEQQLHDQFTSAAELLGMGKTDLIEQAIKQFISSLWKNADAQAQVIAREIVKKAVGSRVNLQRTIDARVRELLEEYDFEAAIKNRLGVRELDPIVPCALEESLTGIDPYFYFVDGGARTTPERLAQMRTRITQRFAGGVLYHIYKTLELYRELDEWRSLAKRTIYYDRLSALQETEPWELRDAALMDYF
jgi:hypothetical protein